jgi:hypothetical protein
MFEPSLTVGLVPRVASRVVATHDYPGTRSPNWLNPLSQLADILHC